MNLKYLLGISLFSPYGYTCVRADNLRGRDLARKDDYVQVCHKGKIISINSSALKAHTKHGDGDASWSKLKNMQVKGMKTIVSAFPNPCPGVKVELPTNLGSCIKTCQDAAESCDAGKLDGAMYQSLSNTCWCFRKQDAASGGRTCLDTYNLGTEVALAPCVTIDECS